MSSGVHVFKRLGRWFKNYLVGVGFVVSAGILVALCAGPKKDVGLEDSASVFLNLQLSGKLQETLADKNIVDELLSQAMKNDADLYLLDLKQKLKDAAADSRVKGLFLEFHGLSGSLAGFSELRSYLETFKESNKPVHAWLPMADNKAFYLASVADRLVLAPLGDLNIPGPYFEMIYFKGALQKLGVDIEVTRAGKYKSAFEPFVRHVPSDETLEMYGAMEKSLRAHLAVSLQKGRKVEDLATVNGWFKRGLFSADKALELGLVDELGYLDETKKRGFNEDVKPHSFAKYQGLSASTLDLAMQKKGDGIALIEAAGEIHLESGGADRAIIPATMSKKISWALENDSVKAVVLRINSPGGSAIAADNIWRELEHLSEKKPLVVSMGGVAASGGYYMAAPARKIFAEESTITGSIGVIGMLPNFKGLQDKIGVQFHLYSKSDRQDLLHPGRSASRADIKILEESIDSVYSTFVSKVAKGRSMSFDDVDKIAQGRVWTGQQAKELGLVDEIGGLWDALQEAKRLAGIDETTEVPILRWHPKMSSLAACLGHIEECLPGGLSSHVQAMKLSLLPESLSPIEAYSHWPKTLQNEPIQAFWPGQAL